eukprot:3008634-Rhodomonas_salina.1
MGADEAGMQRKGGWMRTQRGWDAEHRCNAEGGCENLCAAQLAVAEVERDAVQKGQNLLHQHTPHAECHTLSHEGNKNHSCMKGKKCPN